MSNLVAMQRVDKNGVTNTKHVRVDPKKVAPRSKMPSPQAAKPVKAPTASTSYKRWRVNTDQWSDGSKLKQVVLQEFSPAQTYKCSDAEAFAVLSCVAAKEVLPLLSIDVRSRDGVVAFLAPRQMESLLIDNSAMAEEAAARGFKPIDFLKFAGDFGFNHFETFMDAAEIGMNKEFARVDTQRRESGLVPFTELVLNSQIPVAEIHELGEEFVTNFCTHNDIIINHMWGLRGGLTAYKTLDELKSVVLNSRVHAEFSYKTALNLAAVFGVDIPSIVNRHTYKFVEPLAIALHDAKKSVEESKSILDYRMKVGAWIDDSEQYITLYEAGITPEEATEGLMNDLHATSIIAVRDGIVSPQLADGAL